MKTLLTILLLFVASAAAAQSPGPGKARWKKTSANNYYNWFRPKDSTAGIKHPVFFCSDGSGQAGAGNFTTDGNSISAVAQNGTFDGWFPNGYYGDTTTCYFIFVQNPNSGSTIQKSIILDMIHEAKYVLPDADSTQFYWISLSQTGGVPIMIAADTINLAKQFAAVIACSPLEDTSGQALNNGLISSHTQFRIFDATNDGNGSTSGTLDNVLFYNNGNPTTYFHFFHSTTTNAITDHLAGWYYGMKTTDFNLYVDSFGVFPAYVSTHTNTQIAVMNSYKWGLQYARPASVVTSAPSCTTNSSPANASTVSSASAATLTWNFAATASSYNLYFWSTGSAPGSPTVSGITGLSYNMTGLSASTTYHWFVAPANSFGAATGCSSSATSFVTQVTGYVDSLSEIHEWYDISGAAATDKNTPDYWFDSYGAFNPLTGSVTDPSNTWGLTNGNAGAPFGSFYQHDSSNNNIYYPGLNRNQLVFVDLTGRQNLEDTSRQFTLRRIGLMSDEEAGHTLYFYRVDDILKSADTLRDSSIAYFNTLYRPFDSAVTTGIGGYVERTLTIPVKTRWLGVMATTSGGHTSAFSEMAYIGQYNTGTKGTLWPDMTDSVAGIPPSLTYWSANGIGVIKGNWFEDLKIYGSIGTFIGNDYYDTTSATGINPAHFKLWNDGFTEQTLAYWRSLTNNNQQLFVTMQGASAANDRVGYSTINIDFPRISHPEMPGSWKRHAKLVFNHAAIFGKNVISSGRTIWSSPSSFTNGQNIPMSSGWSNENDAHGTTPWAAAVKTAMEWNGDNHRFCTDCGIYDADSTFGNLSNRSVEADTNGIKVLVLREQWVHHSKPHIKGIDDHHYWSNRDNHGATFPYSEQVYMKAAPYESVFAIRGMNGLSWDRAIVKAYHRFLPGVAINRTESSGISNDSVSAHYEGRGGGEIYTTPVIPGFTPKQSKAILDNRNSWEAMWSGYTTKINYEFENLINNDTTNHAVFSRMGVVDTSSISPPFKALRSAPYYVHAMMFNAIGKRWKPEGDLIRVSGSSDSTGLWRGKLRNIFNTDSICVGYCYGSISGRTGTVTIDFGHAITGPVTKMYPNPTLPDTTGTFSSLTGSGSTLTGQSINENLTLFFALESSGGSPPSCTTNISPANASTVTGQTSATLTWNSASTATSYQVWADGSLVTTVGTTSYNSFGYTANSNHSWYIVPVNGSGAATGCSANATTFTTHAVGVTYSVLRVYRSNGTVVFQLIDESGNILLTEDGLIITL